MKKRTSVTPLSFTPSPELRAHLNLHREGGLNDRIISLIDMCIWFASAPFLSMPKKQRFCLMCSMAQLWNPPSFNIWLRKSWTRMNIWRVSPQLNHCTKSACQRPIHNCWPPSSGSIGEEGKPMSDVLSCRQLTINLKMIAGAIGYLNRNDVAQIICLGGVPCSKSRADSIIRSAGAEKNASGNSHLRGARINRSADATPEEFNAFVPG